MKGHEKHWRLGFAGFGRVNRALARLLIDQREELRQRHGLTFEVTLLATATRGALIDARGLDPLAAFRAGWSSGVSTIEAIRTAPVDLALSCSSRARAHSRRARRFTRTAIITRRSSWKTAASS